MSASLAELGNRYNAWERSDRNDFQRRARILQSIWRDEKGYPMGEHAGRPLGSRLPMPWAREEMANYLTKEIGKLVEKEVETANETGKFYAQPRIFNELLSSQPLCFNLFGELSTHLDDASKVFAGLTGGRVARVTDIKFEHSPGRRNNRYTGDRSAFDVYVEYTAQTGNAGFLGIEVKYHEHFNGVAPEHRERYLEIARDMGCFRPDAYPGLLCQLEQVWRDHLLAGILLNNGDFKEGRFIFLHPAQNQSCRNAIEDYRRCLLNEDTFTSWTLESVVAAIQKHCRGRWIDDFQDRYLAFEKLESAM